jgi:hypothetical protein
MIAFALQAATARAMGSPPADERAAEGPHLLRVFHPPGVVRLVSPAELDAMQGRARSAAMVPTRVPASKHRVVDALRRFARAWVSAQVHRAGF